MQTRPAIDGDLLDLFHWRNDPQTRLMSFDTEAVRLQDHESWFRASLANPDRLIVIGLDGERKIGMVRYDCRDGVAMAAINLNPAFRGQGLSARLLAESEAHLPSSWRIESLEAAVKATNLPSLRAFEKAGYQIRRKTEFAGAQIWICRKI